MMLGMSPGYKICASCYVVKESVPASLCLFQIQEQIYVVYIGNGSRLLYVGPTWKFDLDSKRMSEKLQRSSYWLVCLLYSTHHIMLL
jgi:hypothetical protein